MSAYDGFGVSPVAQSAENKIVNKALSAMPTPMVTGLQLRADISLGSLTLNTIDTEGVVWVCTDIQGWWQQPEAEFPDFNRGWGDGSYDVRGRWMARDMVLTGTFFTQDPSQVLKARQKLIDASSLVYLGDWLVVRETKSIQATVVDPVNNTVTVDFVGLELNQPLYYQTTGTPIPGLKPNTTYYVKSRVVSSGTTVVGLSETVNGPLIDLGETYTDLPNRAPGKLYGSKHSFSIPEFKASYVRISSRPEISTTGARGRTEFSIALRAADPIKYELVGSDPEAGRVATVSTGSVTITNSGSTRVPVLIRVSGTATSSAKITNTTTSQEINFVEAKSTGSILEIDTYNREVLLDTAGVITNGRFYVETLMDWIYLEPGNNVFTASGATFQVEYRSGWLG